MRIFNIQSSGVTESANLAALSAGGMPAQGYVWVSCAREEFEEKQAQVQAMLQALCAVSLLDLHISDLLNQQLPSHYDYTSQYDVLVFRRLAAGASATSATPAPPKGGPPILRRIDTSPVGFAVFDRVLFTVHPTDCAAREAYAAKLLQAASAEDTAATGDFIQTAIKGVAAVASIAAAPFTGGLSLAALPAVAGAMSNQQAQQ